MISFQKVRLSRLLWQSVASVTLWSAEATSADLSPIQESPATDWRTKTDTLASMGIMSAIILAAAHWVITLRRRVREHTRMITPVQLVEDAWHMATAALARHGIRICRKSEEKPSTFAQQHKILQLLVDLIRNARYVLLESGRVGKVMAVKFEDESGNYVKIHSVDRGVGIPEKNLSRISSYDFTTRRNGHGFGLHSSGLAVRELGGTLQGQTEGQDTGATFALRLPYKQPENQNRYAYAR